MEKLAYDTWKMLKPGEKIIGKPEVFNPTTIAVKTAPDHWVLNEPRFEEAPGKARTMKHTENKCGETSEIFRAKFKALEVCMHYVMQHKPTDPIPNYIVFEHLSGPKFKLEVYSPTHDLWGDIHPTMREGVAMWVLHSTAFFAIKHRGKAYVRLRLTHMGQLIVRRKRSAPVLTISMQACSCQSVPSDMKVD